MATKYKLTITKIETDIEYVDTDYKQVDEDENGKAIYDYVKLDKLKDEEEVIYEQVLSQLSVAGIASLINSGGGGK